jgi:hypothetical protein
MTSPGIEPGPPRWEAELWQDQFNAALLLGWGENGLLGTQPVNCSLQQPHITVK